MIAIVGPYGHTDSKIKQYRAIKIAEACMMLLAQGKVGVSPLIYGLGMKTIAGSELPDNYENWGNFCKTLVSACSGVYVLNLEGYDTSTGVAEEISTAKEKGLPIYLVDADTLEVIKDLNPKVIFQSPPYLKM